MEHTLNERAQRDEQSLAKRVILLENLEDAADEITGGAGKFYFGESQFDA